MGCGYYVSKQSKLLKKFDKISIRIEKKIAKYYSKKYASKIRKEARTELENKY
ncbi:hypothetical protein ES703_78974 [subsurface metagenome]